LKTAWTSGRIKSLKSRHVLHNINNSVYYSNLLVLEEQHSSLSNVSGYLETGFTVKVRARYGNKSIVLITCFITRVL